MFPQTVFIKKQHKQHNKNLGEFHSLGEAGIGEKIAKGKTAAQYQCGYESRGTWRALLSRLLLLP